MSNRVRDLVLISLFAALTAVLAYVYLPIPFSTVPITGQTMGVMLSGALLGAKRGFMSQVVYLLLGIVGIPVFAGGQAGLTVLAGPTGGYLISYPIASFIIGYLMSMSITYRFEGVKAAVFNISALTLGGIIIVYTLGVTQMILVTQLPLREALLTGVLPFLIGDAVKIAGTYAMVKAFYYSPLREKLPV